MYPVVGLAPISAGAVQDIIPPSPLTTTTYATYDTLPRPTVITSGSGTATVTYDVWNRITEIAYNNTGPVVHYTYDKDGNLTQRSITQAGTTRTYHYSYDTLNRLTTVNDPSSSSYDCAGATPVGMTLTYDAASNVTAYCNANGTTHYAYAPPTSSRP